MDLEINGKNALVTASSRGLGLGIARKLASEGANVLLCGRSAEKLENAVREINAAPGGSAGHVVVDLTDPFSADLLEQAISDRFGRLDILVNNTGGPPPGAMKDASAELVRKHYDTMVLRVIDLTHRVLPGMREQNWGRVLTVASSGVIQPIPNLGLSNAIRASLVGWSKSMSNELAAHGITFNMLLPGRIQTERVEELDAANAERAGKSLEEVQQAARDTIPAGRYGTVEEFAAVAAFLVSGPASYVNGGMIRCDGGAIKSV